MDIITFFIIYSQLFSIVGLIKSLCTNKKNNNNDNNNINSNKDFSF